MYALSLAFRLNLSRSEVDLDINVKGSRNGSQIKSRIKIRFSAPDSSKTVEAALADARKDADEIGRNKVAAAVGLVGNAQGYVEHVEDGASNLSAFGTVLDKIDVFVNIMDKTASVRGRICVKSS